MKFRFYLAAITCVLLAMPAYATYDKILPPARGGTGSTVAGTTTLVGGAQTVATSEVTATTVILLTGQNSSGVHGELTVSARTPGTDFTITSTSALDTRDVGYVFIEP